jgi:hypothetical protein
LAFAWGFNRIFLGDCTPPINVLPGSASVLGRDQTIKTFSSQVEEHNFTVGSGAEAMSPRTALPDPSTVAASSAEAEDADADLYKKVHGRYFFKRRKNIYRAPFLTAPKRCS